MRLVLKVGSGVLARADGLSLALDEMRRLVAEIAQLRRDGGHQCVLVSSGAVAAGLMELGLRERPADLPSVQALAAIGQARLMQTYRSLFDGHGLVAAQLLLTHQDLDSRIQETEGVQVDVGGRYYETLTALAVGWIAWLFLLIFWKRPKPPAEPDPGPPAPTLAEQLGIFLGQLEAGTLDTASKAKLEMLLLQCWRQELEVDDRRMAAALQEIRGDSRTRDPLQKLQRWLHHPESEIPTTEIAEVIRPYAAKPAVP